MGLQMRLHFGVLYTLRHSMLLQQAVADACL